MSDKETEIRETTRAPDGYAYEYPDGQIRFTNGEEHNGRRPVRAIPYYFESAKDALDVLRLRAELAERDKDAERYRWFRTAMGTSDKRAQESAINAMEFEVNDPTTPEEIDACFDAAMTEDKTR